MNAGFAAGDILLLHDGHERRATRSRPVVLDFGIAKASTQDEATRTGMLKGASMCPTRSPT